MPETKRPLKVFLCHARADKPKVRELYRYLRKRGIRPWFDEVDLVGGQDWQVEIPKALTTSDAILICLTKNSVDKEGYIQKEIKFALDKALEMPEGRIFLIPIRFEECEVPFLLSRYQWVDLFDEAGYARMMRSLKFRASQLNRDTVRVSPRDIREEKLTVETAAREKEEREKAEQEKAEKAARLKLERDAAEKARREEAERKAAEKAARDKAKREAAEKSKRKRAQRWTAQIAALKETFSSSFNSLRLALTKAVPRMHVGRRWTLGIMTVLLLAGVLLWFSRIGLPAIFYLPATFTPMITTTTVTTTFTPTSVPTSLPTVTPTHTPRPTPKPTQDLRVLNPANQHLYLFVKMAYGWHEGRDYCAAQGGYLVTIQAPSENLFVWNLTKDYWQMGAWLGATDEVKEGTWVWVTGEPWKYTNWGIALDHPRIYEPDEEIVQHAPIHIVAPNPSADFLTFSGPMKYQTWNDAPDSPQYFVCEWEPVTPTTTTPPAGSLSTELTDAKGVEMVHVPAGEFTMGGEDGSSNKIPVHQVDLDAFYIDKYEVTNALYSACVDAGICKPPTESYSSTHSSYYGNSQFDDYPVIYMDWYMARTYCEMWRGARLPTEAEWEKAARGTDARIYPWGEEIDCGKANYNDCISDTTAVGSYESNKSIYGVYDMAGNVWEWVSSLYKPYPYSAADGREDLTAFYSRVLRGGSWHSPFGHVSSAYRSALWRLPATTSVFAAPKMQTHRTDS